MGVASVWRAWNAAADEADEIDAEIVDLLDKVEALKRARRDAERRRAEARSDAELYITYVEATTGSPPRREGT